MGHTLGARRNGRKRDRQLGLNRGKNEPAGNPFIGAVLLITFIGLFVYGCIKLERGDEDSASGIGYLVPLSLIFLFVLHDRISAYCRRRKDSTVTVAAQPADVQLERNAAEDAADAPPAKQPPKSATKT